MKHKPSGRWTAVLVFLAVAAAGGIYVYHRTIQEQWGEYAIPLLVGTVILLLIYLIAPSPEQWRDPDDHSGLPHR